MLRFRRRPPQDDEELKTPPPPEDDGHELRMSILEHLDELRKRLLRAFLALVVGTTVGIVVAEPVLAYLLQPYADLYPEGRQLVVLGPTGSVVAYFRVALLVGGILAIPIITYQVLMFVLPGLTRTERRYVIGSLLPITLLFLIGVAFAWLVLMPPAISFLEGFQADIFEPEWTADQYLSFVTSLLFWMGVAFETPLVFFVLSLLGFVTGGVLVRNWRIAIVGAAVAAAFITPTIDPVNMFLVMGPLLGLYVFSILLVVIGTRLARPA
ncbi:MAG: twin-arginine translocase subunit TatC [Anaerolineae bacterium]